MLVREALDKANQMLVECSPTPLLDARILLCCALEITREELMLQAGLILNNSQEGTFFSSIKRRQNFEPIAYIIGQQEFYSLDFTVSQDVLIPRPETELIIDHIIKCTADDTHYNILELGTGSGIISVTLAKNIPHATITAIDISGKALKIAQKNAQQHNVKKQIDFLQSDWYEQITKNNHHYDIIVSNPPYIRLNDQSSISKETIMHEPKIALYGSNDDGLGCYREIIKSAKNYLTNDGIVVVEIGYDQAEAVQNIFQQHQFQNTDIIQDYAGHDRVVIAR
ncbi:MAG: hypothetical protein DGJ47_000680 [Rickettsiaceae bacterium]